MLIKPVIGEQAPPAAVVPTAPPADANTVPLAAVAPAAGEDILTGRPSEIDGLLSGVLAGLTISDGGAGQAKDDAHEQPIPPPVYVPNEPTPTDPSSKIDDDRKTPDTPKEFQGPHEPEKLTDDGLLDVGEPPMRVRKISMDTEDVETQKLIDDINGEVTAAVADCEKTIERSLSEATSPVDAPEEEQFMPVGEHELHRHAGSLVDGPIPAHTTSVQDPFSVDAPSPFASGLASTIIDGATLESASKTASSLLGGFVDTVQHAADVVADKVVEMAGDVGAKVEDLVDLGEDKKEPAEVSHRKASQDLSRHRNSRFALGGDGEEKQLWEETDPALDKVLDSLNEESSAVDRKLSEATPDFHQNGVHDEPKVSNFSSAPQHLGPLTTTLEVSRFSSQPQKLGGKKPVPVLSRPFYFELAWIPRSGSKCALTDEAFADAFFAKLRASTLVLPSEDVAAYVLDSWLVAKKIAVDWKAPQFLLPTRESTALQAFRTMRADELTAAGATLRTALDHCSTKVDMDGAEKVFHTVKIEL
ncbi:unnamed protein product, partial [Mesorhabditis spiculigera]